MNDWDVPIPLVDFKTLQDDNWDITAARVAPHINGVNHAARIAQLADADPALVRETLRHLLYYQVIMMVSSAALQGLTDAQVDIFQYSNMYTTTPAFARLTADESVTSECGAYVTRQNATVDDWPTLAGLYAKLRPGVTIHRWCEVNRITERGIDPRRFVTFGVIKGFLRRVHRWPIIVEPKGPQYHLLSYSQPSASSLAVPDPHRRRVGFSRYGGDSGFSRHERLDRIERGGPMDSAITVHSEGNSSIPPSVSPGSPAPASQRGHSHTLSQSQFHLGRSSGGDTHPSFSSRRGVRSGIGGLPGGVSGMSGGLNSAIERGSGAGSIGRKEQRWHDQEDRLRSLLDGHHHADEIQVSFGMSWAQLEKVLGLDEMKNGIGKKGIAVVYN